MKKHEMNETLAKAFVEGGENEIGLLNQMIEYCASCENEERGICIASANCDAINPLFAKYNLRRSTIKKFC